jgi:hypothetical protein
MSEQTVLRRYVHLVALVRNANMFLQNELVSKQN